MNTQLLFIFVIFLSLNTFATEKKEKLDLKKIAEKYIPEEFYQIKYEGTGKYNGQFLTKENIRISYEPINFKGNKNQYLVAAYWTSSTLDWDGTVCRVKLIKIENGKDSLMPDIKFKPNNDITQSLCEVQLRDYDNNGSNEIIFTLGGALAIFKLGTDELIDVTPKISGRSSLGSEFTNILISDSKINGVPILVEELTRVQEPPESLTSIYIFKDQFIKIGSFAHYEIIKKEQLEPGFKFKSDFGKIPQYPYPNGRIDIDWPKVDPLLPDKISGTYELEIKNLSEHERAVSVDLVVNGVQAMKPEDFCKEKPINPHIKDEKKKNIEDDDDNNDGSNKRCELKNSVKVNVQMKAGKNILIMKMFGKKDAVIQLTLNKKN